MYPRIAFGLVVAGVLCLIVAAFAALSNHGFEGELTGGSQAATDAAVPAEEPANGRDAVRRTEGGEGAAGDAPPAAAPPQGAAPAAEGPTAAEAPGEQEEETAAHEQAGTVGVPPYSPVGETLGDGVREIAVETTSTGEPEMHRIASDLLSRHAGGEGEVLLVEFFRGAGTAAEEETGFALAFPSKAVALAPDLHYSEEEVEEILAEEGGVRAVSYEDFSEENPALADDLRRAVGG